jgi:hypothetical protein
MPATKPTMMIQISPLMLMMCFLPKTVAA